MAGLWFLRLSDISHPFPIGDGILNPGAKTLTWSPGHLVACPVVRVQLNPRPVILSTMDGLSLGLILLSAVAHSSWNLLLEQSDNKEVFVWGLLAGGSVMLAPLGGALFYYYPVATPGYWLVIVSAVLQILYLVLLGRGYAQVTCPWCIPSRAALGQCWSRFWPC